MSTPYTYTRYTKEYGKTLLTGEDWRTGNVRGTAHRLDGPAIISGEGLTGYYIDGVYHNKEDYWRLIVRYKSMPVSIRRCHNLWWVREL